jgi:hypothetical protein
MTNKEMKKAAAYQATMLMVRQMLKSGIITRSEYDEIDRIMAEKYGLSLSVIFRIIP